MVKKERDMKSQKKLRKSGGNSGEKKTAITCKSCEAIAQVAVEYRSTIRSLRDDLQKIVDLPHNSSFSDAWSIADGALEKLPENIFSEIKKMKNNKCWLCGSSGADTTIIVECDVPRGKHTKPHNVRVHLGCYMDMDQ